MESTRHIRHCCHDLSFALTTRDRFIFPKFIILPGQYYDQETGLHYNYFRDYDPSTGRYIESDPIGLVAGMNTYVYISNSPVSFTDPLGLIKCNKCTDEFNDCIENVRDNLYECIDIEIEKAIKKCVGKKDIKSCLKSARNIILKCGLIAAADEVRCAAEWAACKKVCDDCE